MEEEFQEADVLWPWPDTPPPSPEEEGRSYDYNLPAAAPELYQYDAAVVVAFSCEPFSEPAASWSASSTSSTLSALLSSDWSDDGGFFLSGASTVSAAGLELDATEEFLEADALWPDTEADEAEDDEFFWLRCRSRHIEEAAASAAAAVFCGKREGCSGPLAASSPIDIPMVTRGAAAARRRRP